MVSIPPLPKLVITKDRTQLLDRNGRRDTVGLILFGWPTSYVCDGGRMVAWKQQVLGGVLRPMVEGNKMDITF